jgi:hypothetical protein
VYSPATTASRSPSRSVATGPASLAITTVAPRGSVATVTVDFSWRSTWMRVVIARRSSVSSGSVRT